MARRVDVADWNVCEISVDSFKKAGQLQRRAVSRSKTKLLVTQQHTLVYFPDEPRDQDLIDNLANGVK
jgi:hypothetical protein